MRISEYWFRTRRDSGKYKTAIRLVNPKKGWSTACKCDTCGIHFNRTFESTRFGFDKCDRCSMKELNKEIFTDEVRNKISKATSMWHSSKDNKKAHAKLVKDRYKDRKYAKRHKEACQKRSNDPEYRQKLSENAARGKEHAIKTSCGLQGIERHEFIQFKSDENKIERAKFSKISKQCLEKANYTCDICEKEGGRLNAHHLDGWHWAIDKRFDLNNLVCLCHGCHSLFHKKCGTRKNTKDQYNVFKAERGK